MAYPMAPWRPTKHGEDGEQGPTKGIGGLMRYDSEDDADHDADQRHEIAYPKRHLALPR